MGSVVVSRRQWLRLVRPWWGFESWTTADRRSASFSRHLLRCENHATPQAMASSAPDHPAVPTRDLRKIRYDDADADDIGCGWIGTFSWAHPFLFIHHLLGFHLNVQSSLKMSWTELFPTQWCAHMWSLLRETQDRFCKEPFYCIPFHCRWIRSVSCHKKSNLRRRHLERLDQKTVLAVNFIW